MSEKIEPALAAEVWAKIRQYKNHGLFAVIALEGGNDTEIGAIASRATRCGDWDAAEREDNRKREAAAIAALNDALPDDDPRKITRDKIRLLRETVGEFAVQWQIDLEHLEAEVARAATKGGRVRAKEVERVVGLVALADALESYLPPEGS